MKQFVFAALFLILSIIIIYVMSPSDPLSTVSGPGESSSSFFDNAVLIGYTGFVGSNILLQNPNMNIILEPNRLFNSSNMKDIAHVMQENINSEDPKIDMIICAGAPGFKLGANELGTTIAGQKYDDTVAMDKLMEDIDRINTHSTDSKSPS